MRYPADSNLMTIRFQTEIYNYIKECDPEAVMLGEGVSLDGPVNVFSINGNPVRAIDGMGPRDFFLNLNRYAPKRLVIDQGGSSLPAGGMCKIDLGEFPPEHHRFLVELLEKRGGPRAFTHLPGDLSILDNLLFFPKTGHTPPNTEFFPARDCFALPAPWNDVVRLRGKFNGAVIEKEADGFFRKVVAGVYEMERA
jgi:hypothetical protein